MEEEAVRRVQAALRAVKKGDSVITDLTVVLGVVDVTPPDAESACWATTGVEVWTITIEPGAGQHRFAKQE